jgi:hypothetical protein
MTQKSQVQKFRDAARAVGTHDSEKRFNATLKGLAKDRRDAKTSEGRSTKDRAEKLGQNDPNATKAKPRP